MTRSNLERLEWYETIERMIGRCLPKKIVLLGFVWVKLNSDPFVLGVAVVTMMLIAIGEQLFLGSKKQKQVVHLSQDNEHHH